MSSAIFQPQHFGRTWLGAVMARPAKCNQVFNRIGLRDAPRNNVVNIQFLSLSIKRALRSPALAASVAIARPNFFGHFLPVCSAPVVLRCSALPLRVFFFGFSDNLSRHVAFVRTKAASLTIETAKLFSATIARQGLRLFAVPSCAVIAGHFAKSPSVGVVGVNFKSLSAPFANLFGSRLCLLSLAGAGAISPTLTAPKGLAAFFARFFDVFHVRKIARKKSKNKYFDIACKRVEEAYRQPDLFVDPPKPAVQEGFDI